MANFNKAFNFRGGFQVDTDVLIVRGQNIGIGSTIPNERLVVNGTIQTNGLDVLSTEAVTLSKAEAGILTVTEYLNVGIPTINPNAFVYPFGRPQVQITTGIITSANPAIGVVTYYGDGAQLLNLPTSQWLDIDVGLGFTSIYAQGNVGVATDDPRYEFQVGGVPFDTRSGPPITAQRGVGIERGNVYASGIMSARGEFIGVGSNITVINADNIAIGSIGSMRYGSVINTEEVYADRFIGVADTAASVTLDAELIFTSGIATDFQTEELIVTGISSLNVVKVLDHIQVGDRATPGNVGDIEVFKDSGTSAYIYSLSDSGAGNVFVGRERVGGQNEEYGGLRKGFIPGVNITDTSDLDLVNFDVGNVNYYLHSGAGGPSATTGAFRWIYGQTNTIMADLDKAGKLSLSGNVDPDLATLDVTGKVFTGSIDASGQISGQNGLFIAGISTFTGDTEFSADVTVNNILIEGDISLDRLLIGDDPSTGGQGTLIQETSAYIAGVAQFQSGSPAIFNTSIQATLFSGDVGAGSISFTNSITGPSGFAVLPNGDVNTQGSVGASGNVVATGQLSGGTLSVGSDGIVNGNLQMGSAEVLGDLDGNSATFTSVETDSLTINGSLGSINVDDVTATGTVSADNVSATSVFADNIGGGSLGSPADATLSSDIDANTNDIKNVGELDTSVVVVDDYIVMGGKRLSFDFGDTNTPGIGTMIIKVSNLATGLLEKEVSLPYDNDNN